MFHAAISVPALTEGWLKTLRKGGGPGGDGETVAQFARMADFRIARLAYELQARLYRPGPLRRVAIPKRTGGSRVLSIPCVVDRVAQRAATGILSAVLEPQFEDSSFAYRPGRSVAQAVARVDLLRREGFHFVVDADIRTFFDRVPHALILQKLAAHGVDPQLSELVDLWLDGFSDDGIGLAQGSPLSPLLANLHLDALDEAFGPRGPVRIVRFADDFVLLTRTRPGAEGALSKARDLLAQNGLDLNLAKTRIVPFDQALRFLGHVFVRGLVLTAPEDDAPQIPILSRGAPPSSGSDDAAEEDAAQDALAATFDADPRERVAGSTPNVAPSAAFDPAAAALDLIRTTEQEEEDFATGLAPLYVLEPGRRLVAERDGFVVLDGGRARLRLPPALVGRIDLGAQVEAEDTVFRLAAAHAIPVTLLNEAGLPQAVLMPAIRDDAGLHLAQARLALDPALGAGVARLLVGARIRNAQALLRRLNHRRGDATIAAACDAMRGDWRKAEAAANLQAVRDVEAQAARHYWPALGLCLDHGFQLNTRRGVDTATPFNAILDFTASLLTRDMRAAVLRARLHPGFGVLHVSGDRRDACVYDLIEAFRAPLAEGLAVYLVNNRILRAEDFLHDPAAPGHGIRLLPASARKLVQGYESWLARSIQDPRTGRSSTWRGLLLIEARRYARAAEAVGGFLPYLMKH